MANYFSSEIYAMKLASTETLAKDLSPYNIEFSSLFSVFKDFLPICHLGPLRSADLDFEVKFLTNN